MGAEDDVPSAAADPRDSGNPWTTRIWLRRGTGLEFDRLAMFSDAVFAIALTLVAVEIGVPDLEDPRDPAELWGAFRRDLPTITAFFVTFVVVSGYWLANHRFMAALRGYTSGFRRLTMLYLATVAFLPYPASTFGRYPDNAVAVALLALAASAVSTMEAVVFWAAPRSDLFLQPLSRAQAHRILVASLSPVGVFALSVPVAFLLHPLAGVAAWFLNPVLGIVHGRAAPAR